MSAPPAFPILPGQGWSVHKKPTFSTIVAEHVSGREARASNWQYPLWEYELAFEGLASNSASYAGLGAQSLQSLMGLFLQCQGQFGTFLYTDPTDFAAAGQAIGAGDGAKTSFTLGRSLGGFFEPCSWVTGVTPFLNGVAQISGFSLSSPNLLVFASAPAAGVAVTASINYAYVCRFLDDHADFEQFMQNLWALKSLKFRSVRTS